MKNINPVEETQVAGGGMAGNGNGNESGDETSSDSDSSKSTYMSSGINSEEEKKQEFLNY